MQAARRKRMVYLLTNLNSLLSVISRGHFLVSLGLCLTALASRRGHMSNRSFASLLYLGVGFYAKQTRFSLQQFILDFVQFPLQCISDRIRKNLPAENSRQRQGDWPVTHYLTYASPAGSLPIQNLRQYSTTEQCPATQLESMLFSTKNASLAK